LRANVTGVPDTRWAATTVVMSDGDADAKTSAGAPDTIWVARAPDEPKLNWTDVPGCRRWKLVASWVNVSVSDDAADTVIEPDNRGGAVEVVVGVEDELEQAAVTTATAHSAARTARRLDGRLMRG
jgi:hypothetical protein